MSKKERNERIKINSEIREFYEWLGNFKSELLAEEFRPKLIEYIVDRLYCQYLYEDDMNEFKTRIRDNGFESPVADWDNFDLINAIRVAKLEEFFRECSELHKKKPKLWEEYTKFKSNKV
jgi:hypothetical protein